MTIWKLYVSVAVFGLALSTSGAIAEAHELHGTWKADGLAGGFNNAQLVIREGSIEHEGMLGRLQWKFKPLGSGQFTAQGSTILQGAITCSYSLSKGGLFGRDTLRITDCGSLSNDYKRY